eukprot:Gb_28586 [translate_table: standard]
MLSPNFPNWIKRQLNSKSGIYFNIDQAVENKSVAVSISCVVSGTNLIPSETPNRLLLVANVFYNFLGTKRSIQTAAFALKRYGNLDRSHVRKLCMQERIDCSVYDSSLQSILNNRAPPEAKLVHARMVQTGNEYNDISISNQLLIMYAKCGTLVDARIVFEQMTERDVVSWTAMIATYSKQGLFAEALTLFCEMQRTGIQPNPFTFASVLPACANLEDLESGKEIHEEIIRSGFESDLFVGNSLVDMYAKCGNLENARNLFDKMPQRDVVSWSVMIAGYVYNWHGEEALKIFRQMQLEGVKPNTKTLASMLPACAKLAALEQGKEIHEKIIRSGFQSDAFVGNALVDMYAKCGSIRNARYLFDNMHQRDIVSWTAMIAGYAQNGHVDDALKIFLNMPKRNVASWTAMIAGYAQNGYSKEALKFYQKMQVAGVRPNSKTFASVLLACANLAAVELGQEIHGDIIRNGFQSNIFVASALVDMYVKCGSIENARELFDKMHERNVVSWTAMVAGYGHNGHIEEALKLFQKMPRRNVVSWTAMIAGYAHNGHCDKAVKLFRQMQLAGMKPNSKTFTSVLRACANLPSLEQGKEIHEEIVRAGVHSDIFVGNALVDMYAKCGSIENAQNVFDKMPERDVVSWTAMIKGYGMHGCGKEALNLFEQMQKSGMNPDHVTLVGVLSACCHAGLVDEGWQYFNCMSQYYHITPKMEHYGCMVDILGRAGRLDEAQNFVSKMPIKPDATVWGCLLGACRIHNNLELGERVAECLFEVDPKSAAPYVLLSNIYAAVGRWDDIEKVRKMMKDRRVKKNPGCSWIEFNNQVYAFLIGDGSHPEKQKKLCIGEIA